MSIPNDKYEKRFMQGLDIDSAGSLVGHGRTEIDWSKSTAFTVKFENDTPVTADPTILNKLDDDGGAH